jgi:hypothetical protein
MYKLINIKGRNHGLKHSPAIAKEITKDSILITLFVIGNLFLVFEYASRDTQEQKDWLNYFYSDLKT